jgi:hypothetical protein
MTNSHNTELAELPDLVTSSAHGQKLSGLQTLTKRRLVSAF